MSSVAIDDADPVGRRLTTLESAHHDIPLAPPPEPSPARGYGMPYGCVSFPHEATLDGSQVFRRHPRCVAQRVERTDAEGHGKRLQA
jgi:hypothetical protein